MRKYKTIQIIIFIIISIFFILKTTLSQQLNTSLLTISLPKKIYSTDEVIPIKVTYPSPPPDNTSLEIILNGENRTETIIPLINDYGIFEHNFTQLPEGNYKLTAILNSYNNTYQNSTEFSVKETDLICEKKKYYVNETITFKIISLPESKQEIIFSGPIIQKYSFVTDKNGIYILNMSFNVPGNYTAEINGKNITIEIFRLEQQTKPKKLYLLIKKEHTNNEPVTLTVKGTANTSYILRIITELNTTIFEITDILRENKSYTLDFLATGHYRAELEYNEETISRDFYVAELTPEMNFTIDLSKDNFNINEPVKFSIIGEPNKDFILKIYSDTQSVLYNFSTNNNGIFSFPAMTFPEGNYSIEVIINNFTISSRQFTVFNKTEMLEEIEKNTTKPKITVTETKYEQIVLNETIIWEQKITIENNENKTIFVSFELPIPDNAEILEITTDLDISLPNKRHISFEMKPNQTLFLVVRYKTPAPIIIESDPVIRDDLWEKNVTILTTTEIDHVNISVYSNIPENIDSITLLSDGIEMQSELITEGDGYKLYWIMDNLKNHTYTIKGIVNKTYKQVVTSTTKGRIDVLPISLLADNAYYYLDSDLNSNTNGIEIVSRSNITIDCKGHRIYGNRNYNGITIENSKKITITNCKIENFENGIVFKNSINNVISNNIINGNQDGIILLNTNNTIISDNNVSGNSDQGLIIYSSFNNEITDNAVTYNFGFKTLEKIEELAKN